jgi:hypothetical protein
MCITLLLNSTQVHQSLAQASISLSLHEQVTKQVRTRVADSATVTEHRLFYNLYLNVLVLNSSFILAFRNFLYPVFTFSLLLHSSVFISFVVDWGTILQAGRSLILVPKRSLNSFSIYLILPAALWMAQRLTEPLKEMSTRKYLGGQARPASKADNLTAICEPIVYTMWDPQHLTTL